MVGMLLIATVVCADRGYHFVRDYNQREFIDLEWCNRTCKPITQIVLEPPANQ